MKYEYDVVKVQNNLLYAGPLKKNMLNERGEQGWRCFSIQQGNLDTEFVFEREIKPPPPKSRTKTIKKD